MYYRCALYLAFLAMTASVFGQDNKLQIPNKMPAETRSREQSLPSPKATVTQEEIEEGHVMVQVITLFLKSVKQGATTQAYYAYTSEAFRKETSYKDFKIFVDRFVTLSRNIGFELLDINHFEDKAAVTADIISLDHQENTIVFDMIYEAGRWRIFGIQIYAKQVNTE